MEKRNRRKSRSASQVAYTPARAINKAQLLVRLAGVAGVVLALLFTMTIFFKVGGETVATPDGADVKTVEMPKVYVTGNDKYTQEQIVGASAIHIGDNLLGLSKAQISGRIIQALPYIGTIRVRISLPDSVYLSVTELDMTYAIEDDLGAMWIISSTGRVVEKIANADAIDYPRLEGIRLTDAAPGKEAIAQEQTVFETNEAGESVPVAVAGAERLQALLKICKELEQVGILGEVTRIDASVLTQLEMDYGQQFKILLGDSAAMAKKISQVKSAVSQLGKGDMGTLDASFTLRPDQVIYTPEQEEE